MGALGDSTLEQEERLRRFQGLVGEADRISSGLAADDHRRFDVLEVVGQVRLLYPSAFLHALLPLQDAKVIQMQSHHGIGVELQDSMKARAQFLHTHPHHVSKVMFPEKEIPRGNITATTFVRAGAP